MDDLLLENDTRADLMDSVIELHPNLSIKIQNTIINLIALVAQAQLDYAKPLIEEQARKDERDRILRLLPEIPTRYTHNKTCFANIKHNLFRSSLSINPLFFPSFFCHNQAPFNSGLT